MSDFEEIKKSFYNVGFVKTSFHTSQDRFFKEILTQNFQISQAPSIHVHESGLPFNDASGKRLRQEWYQISDACFYDPNNFYIASMGHCYPGKKSVEVIVYHPNIVQSTGYKKKWQWWIASFISSLVHLLPLIYSPKYLFMILSLIPKPYTIEKLSSCHTLPL